MEFRMETVKTEKKEFKIPISIPETIDTLLSIHDVLSVIHYMEKKGYTVVNSLKMYEECSDGFEFTFEMSSCSGDFRLVFGHDFVRFYPRDESKRGMEIAFNDLDECITEVVR